MRLECTREGLLFELAQGHKKWGTQWDSNVPVKVYFSSLHKAIWMRHPMRLECTREGLLFELAQGHINEAPNETRMYPWRFTFRACTRQYEWGTQWDSNVPVKVYFSSLLKAIWMRHPMRLECTREGLLFELAQGHINEAPNETRMYSWRFTFRAS